MFFSFPLYASEIDKLGELFSKSKNEFVQEISRIKKESPALSEIDEVKFRYFEGLALILQNNMDEAAEKLTYTISNSNDPELTYKAMTSLVTASYVQGKFVEAFGHGLQMSDDKFDGIDYSVKSRGKIVLASSVAESGLTEDALNLLDTINLDELNPPTRCAAVSLIAQIGFKNKVLKMTIEQLEGHQIECSNQGLKLYSNLIKAHSALIVLEQGQVDAALEILEEDKQNILEFNYDSISGGWFTALAEAWALKGDFEKARDYAEQAREFEATFITTTALPVYASLARTYEHIGELEESYRYIQSYQQAYEKAYQSNLTAAVAYHAATMQAAQRQQEIALLNKEKEVLQLDNELSKAEAENTRLYLVVTVAVIALLTVLIYRSQRSQERLQKRITYDKLTQVYSRDYFEDLMAASLNQAKRKQDELGVVLFDLDKFKTVNDNYGHQIGDWVLERTAYIAKQVLRKHDAVGRLGGEEFAILLPGCDAERAHHIADAVRQAITRIDTTECGESFNISASFGVTTTKLSGYNQRTLLADADAALYTSKHAGRNQVSVATP